MRWECKSGHQTSVTCGCGSREAQRAQQVGSSWLLEGTLVSLQALSQGGQSSPAEYAGAELAVQATIRQVLDILSRAFADRCSAPCYPAGQLTAHAHACCWFPPLFSTPCTLLARNCFAVCSGACRCKQERLRAMLLASRAGTPGLWQYESSAAHARPLPMSRDVTVVQ